MLQLIKSRVFRCLKKFLAPLKFGVQELGRVCTIFWLWTIFLVMDHLKKVVTGTFSAFLRVF